MSVKRYTFNVAQFYVGISGGEIVSYTEYLRRPAAERVKHDAWCVKDDARRVRVCSRRSARTRRDFRLHGLSAMADFG